MDLTKRAAVFRVAVRRLGTRGVGRRYPEEMKREASRISSCGGAGAAVWRARRASGGCSH